MQWGLDIVELLPMAPTQKRFLLAAIDYFSKWVDVEAYDTIKDIDVRNFVWQTIVCRFNIPRALVFEIGIQFNNRIFL